MQGILERAKKLVFKAKFCRNIKIFQKILTPKTGFLYVPKLVRLPPVRHNLRYKELKELGYLSLVNLYYKYKKNPLNAFDDIEKAMQDSLKKS